MVKSSSRPPPSRGRWRSKSPVSGCTFAAGAGGRGVVVSARTGVGKTSAAPAGEPVSLAQQVADIGLHFCGRDGGIVLDDDTVYVRAFRNTLHRTGVRDNDHLVLVRAHHSRAFGRA